jgi:hypothetical protein
MAMRLPVVSILLAIVASGCVFSSDTAPTDECSCANTQAIVTTIDWLGDGTVANRVASGLADGRPQVELRFSSFDDPAGALAALDVMVGRFESSGLEPTMPDSTTAQIRTGEASAAVEASEPFAGNVFLTVVVRISVADEHATEALQPFVSALGTIG